MNFPWINFQTRGHMYICIISMWKTLLPCMMVSWILQQKMFQEVQCLVLKDVKVNFSRKIYTCIRELKYGITAWVYGNFIMLWCNPDREVGTAKLTHIPEYLAAYPTRNKLFLQHIIVHIPGTFLPLILYLEIHPRVRNNRYSFVSLLG